MKWNFRYSLFMSLLPCHELLDNTGGWESMTALEFSLALCVWQMHSAVSIRKEALGWSGVTVIWSYYLALQGLKAQLFCCSAAAEGCISDLCLVPGHYSLHFDAFHHQLSDAPPALPARTLRKVKRKWQESRERWRIGSWRNPPPPLPLSSSWIQKYYFYHASKVAWENPCKLITSSTGDLHRKKLRCVVGPSTSLHIICCALST